MLVGVYENEMRVRVSAAKSLQTSFSSCCPETLANCGQEKVNTKMQLSLNTAQSDYSPRLD